MAEAIVSFFRELIGNDYITVLIVSMIPFVEVRGSIPIAIAMNMNPFAALGLAFAGSLIIAPILLSILMPILKWLKKFKIFKGLVEAVEEGFKGKANKVVKDGENFDASVILKKKLVGTYVFVAFPIPMTGVWTGSAVACFLNLPFWWAFLMISLGNLTACIIMTILSYFFSAYINIILTAILCIVVAAILVYIATVIVRIVKRKKAAKKVDNKEGEDSDIKRGDN